jgi:hypothetical protein
MRTNLNPHILNALAQIKEIRQEVLPDLRSKDRLISGRAEYIDGYTQDVMGRIADGTVSRFNTSVMTDVRDISSFNPDVFPVKKAQVALDEIKAAVRDQSWWTTAKEGWKDLFTLPDLRDVP